VQGIIVSMDSSGTPQEPSQEAAGFQIRRFCEAALARGLSKNTVKNYRSDLQGALRWFSVRTDKQLIWKDFFLNDLNEYRYFLSTSVRQTTGNRKLAGLRAFLKWSADAQTTGSREPLPEVRRIISDPGRWARPRWLTLKEQWTLNRTVRVSGNPLDRAIIAILLYTGVRTSQLGKLKWGDFRVSRKHGAMAVYRPTYGDYVEIPLNLFAREAILALGYAENKGSSRSVFKGRSGPMSRRWVEMTVRRFGESALIFDLTPLVLRNTFIANMLDFGVNPVTISDILGDPVLDLLRYYAPPQETELEKAVEEPVYAVLNVERNSSEQPRNLFPQMPDEGL
jgi:site-specific recombinase XerD